MRIGAFTELRHSMSDDEDEFSLRTFARDAVKPHCCLHEPDMKCTPTAKLGGLAVPSWPLSPETVTTLMTKYAGRVPAKDANFRGMRRIVDGGYFVDSYFLGELDPAPDDAECSMAFSMTLAHVAVDLTGDASKIKPATRRPPRHTFATVVYFFPSTCVGGAVTITHGQRTTTFEALDGCCLSFYSSCDVTVAPITSGHRSCAVYYAAYDMEESIWDDEDIPKAWYAPRPLPSIQELQNASRRCDPDGYIGVTVDLQTRSLTPTFDSLVGCDKAIVDLLLVADVFDIAFARASDNNDAIPPLPETLHPLCNTPALVQEVYRQTPTKDFAEDTDEYEPPGCFLLVWPKVNRVRILGYDRTMALLRANLDGDVIDDLGFGSLHGIFEAAFLVFYPHPNTNFRLDPDQITNKMASLLYDYGDVGLIEAFLAVHDWWADSATMADWLLAVLRRFGASRFLHRLRTADVSIFFAAQLVSRATAGDELAQVIACDCVPRWWPRVLHYLVQTVRDKPKAVCCVFDMEMYVLTHPINTATSTYLRRHLPDGVVRLVAVYLAPARISLLDALRNHSHLAGYLAAAAWPHRNSISHPRLASYLPLATEYLCAPGVQTHFSSGHVPSIVYLALLTVGTPAFAKVDAAVQKLRRYSTFTSECAGLDTASLSAMQALVMDEYMRQPW